MYITSSYDQNGVRYWDTKQHQKKYRTREDFRNLIVNIMGYSLVIK